MPIVQWTAGAKNMPSGAVAKTYYTNFPSAPENPVSEGGMWVAPSVFNAVIATTTSPNRTYSTQAGSPTNYNDSCANLNGFKPNVMIQATIYKDPTIDTINGAHEAEILFRVAPGSTAMRAYECNWSSGGYYSQIVTWNGVAGSYTFLAGQTGSSFTAPQTGDVVRATIVSGTITTYIQYAVANGGDGVTWTQLQTATDSTWTDGQPGMGMWFDSTGGGSNPQKYGFTDFYVTEI